MPVLKEQLAKELPSDRYGNFNYKEKRKTQNQMIQIQLIENSKKRKEAHRNTKKDSDKQSNTANVASAEILQITSNEKSSENIAAGLKDCIGINGMRQTKQAYYPLRIQLGVVETIQTEIGC